MPALSLELLPPRMYVEPTALGQLLNFDLLFANAGDRAYELTSVALEVFDRDRARVFRRVLDEHGLRPAIHTIPDRIVPAGGSLLVFNPVHTFRRDVDLASVRCVCELRTESGETETVVAEAAPSEYGQQSEFHLPLVGRVLVANGHDFLSPHRRIDPAHPLAAELGLRANSGRYAEDYSLAGEDGEATGLGAPVRAPGAGAVIAAVGEVPDNRTLREGGVEFPEFPPDPPTMIFGNHVVIDHGHGEVSVLGHLQHGSVDVSVGDTLRAKQRIARLGLSGNTDFPHVHYQLQDGPDALRAEGLPFRFEGLGWLEPGTIVES